MSDQRGQQAWAVTDERIAYELLTDLSRLNVQGDVIRARVQFLGPWQRPVTEEDVSRAIAWLFRATDESLERH